MITKDSMLEAADKVRQIRQVHVLSTTVHCIEGFLFERIMEVHRNFKKKLFDPGLLAEEITQRIPLLDRGFSNVSSQYFCQ